MDVVLIGHQVKTMLDTRVTNNFMAERMVFVLGLKVTKSSSRIKTMNSSAQPIQGMTTIDLKIGEWKQVG